MRTARVTEQFYFDQDFNIEPESYLLRNIVNPTGADTARVAMVISTQLIDSDDGITR